jgi:diguanylate cyclase (GGDEF)-like protein
METNAPSNRTRRFARLLAAAFGLYAAVAVFATTDVDSILRQADRIKYKDNVAFLTLLQTLDAQADGMSRTQHDWLAYLHAWQKGFRGDYPDAVAAFRELLARTSDNNVRARARISLIFDQVNADHFEDAFVTLTDLLASEPGIDDDQTRFLVYDTAAYVYSRGGEYDLAMGYIDNALARLPDDRSACSVRETQIWIMQQSGKLQPDDARIRDGLETCQRADEPANYNSILVQWASAYLASGQPRDSLKLLQEHKADVLATHSAALTSEVQSIMALGWLRLGDLDQARASAQAALTLANRQEQARSVANAYNVLYLVAKEQGDDKAALAWHEKYTAADKANLNDVSTRALAYQKVHQHVLDNQRKLTAANDANRMLALRQQVESQKARTRLLYILLLLSGLLIVGGWAWRTKRSQLKFRELARCDGLTGIANRQHFFDAAQSVLRDCARDSRQACVLALDLDHFKSVNDMHGHAAGDIALKRAVAACKARLRSTDVFGRLGGEEFAILMPDVDATVARSRAEEMRRDIAAARRDGDADILITASFGLACTRDCGHNLPALLAAADDALYAAKRAGRNRVEMYPHTVPA